MQSNLPSREKFQPKHQLRLMRSLSHKQTHDFEVEDMVESVATLHTQLCATKLRNSKRSIN